MVGGGGGGGGVVVVDVDDEAARQTDECPVEHYLAREVLR